MDRQERLDLFSQYYFPSPPSRGARAKEQRAEGREKTRQQRETRVGRIETILQGINFGGSDSDFIESYNSLSTEDAKILLISSRKANPPQVLKDFNDKVNSVANIDNITFKSFQGKSQEYREGLKKLVPYSIMKDFKPGRGDTRAEGVVKLTKFLKKFSISETSVKKYIKDTTTDERAKLIFADLIRPLKKDVKTRREDIKTKETDVGQRESEKITRKAELETEKKRLAEARVEQKKLDQALSAQRGQVPPAQKAFQQQQAVVSGYEAQIQANRQATAEKEAEDLRIQGLEQSNIERAGLRAELQGQRTSLEGLKAKQGQSQREIIRLAKQLNLQEKDVKDVGILKTRFTKRIEDSINKINQSIINNPQDSPEATAQLRQSRKERIALRERLSNVSDILDKIGVLQGEKKDIPGQIAPLVQSIKQIEKKPLQDLPVERRDVFIPSASEAEQNIAKAKESLRRRELAVEKKEKTAQRTKDKLDNLNLSPARRQELQNKLSNLGNDIKKGNEEIQKFRQDLQTRIKEGGEEARQKLFPDEADPTKRGQGFPLGFSMEEQLYNSISEYTKKADLVGAAFSQVRDPTPAERGLTGFRGSPYTNLTPSPTLFFDKSGKRELTNITPALQGSAPIGTLGQIEPDDPVLLTVGRDLYNYDTTLLGQPGGYGVFTKYGGRQKAENLDVVDVLPVGEGKFLAGHKGRLGVDMNLLGYGEQLLRTKSIADPYLTATETVGGVERLKQSPKQTELVPFLRKDKEAISASGAYNITPSTEQFEAGIQFKQATKFGTSTSGFNFNPKPIGAYGSGPGFKSQFQNPSGTVFSAKEAVVRYSGTDIDRETLRRSKKIFPTLKQEVRLK